MSVNISPVGINAITANTLSFAANYVEKLCDKFCVDSTVQPQVSITYRTGTPRLNLTTVFIPITATISIVTPCPCGCSAKTTLRTENFLIPFQNRTSIPTTVTLTSVGRDIQPTHVKCGCTNELTITDSLTLEISADPAPAA